MVARSKNEIFPIAYILGEFPSRTETFIAREIDYIKQHFPLRLLSTRPGGDQKAEAVLYSAPLLSLAMAYTHAKVFFRTPRFYLRFWQSARRLFGKHSITVFGRALYFYSQIHTSGIRHIHAHFANHPACIARLLADRLKITYSFSAHARDIYTRNPYLGGNMAEALFVATCTEYNQCFLRSKAGEMHKKIHLNYHGIELARWEYKPRDTFDHTLLTVGRLVDKKGHRYLTEALSLLKKSGHIFHWYIVGEGPCRKELQRLIRKYGLRAQVHFLGWKKPEEVRELYHRYSVLVQPSVISGDGDRDGVPNVILEGMASGIPVVSTGISGIGEVLREDCSMIVPEKNAASLAETLLLLAKDNDFRKEIIENARERICGFDSEEHLPELKNIFESYLSNDGSA